MKRVEDQSEGRSYLEEVDYLEDDVKRLRTPLTDEAIADLRAGDQVLLTGTLYTGRDAAHKRFAEALDRGESLPIDLAGQILYYTGPSPARPGMPIGSAGPTTASRMDSYTPRLLALGLKATIGKGKRSAEVREAMRRYHAVYFGAIGGLGALLARQIKKAEVVAYPDLPAGPVYRLEVEDLPLVVINDVYGGDLYETAPAEWASET